MERDPDLQTQMDSLRSPWLVRRGLVTVLAVVVVLGLVGLFSPLLIWQVALLTGVVLSESEIRLVRGSKTVRDLELRLTGSRVALVAAIALIGTAVVGPNWLIPASLAMVLASSATQLRERGIFAMVAIGSSSYLVMTILVGIDVLTPFEPAGLSGEVSTAAAILISIGLLPALTGFVLVRSRGADQSRHDLERTVEDLQEAQQQLRSSQTESQQLSERLAAEIERKTDELALRNRALSIVNAISFALSEPFEDDTALRRAARLVARLLDVDAVQIRELQGGTSKRPDVLVGPTPDVQDLPNLPAVVIDDAISLRSGVSRSAPDESAGPPYVIVPMVTRGTVRGSLTVIGEECRDWTEQELHLLTLIGREMGAALESARLYRDALSLADRELLIAQSSALLASGAPLHEQLDELLAKIGTEFGSVFASVTSVEAGTVGPELSSWDRDETAPLSGDQLNALAALIPNVPDTGGVPLVLAADYPIDASVRGQFGSLVFVPILTAQLESALPGAADESGVRDLSKRVPAGVLLLAAPVDADWSSADLEVIIRLASLVGRRLEGEQLVQLQQHRFDELAALTEIGRVIQQGTDSDRLYSEFAIALHRLVPFELAYIAGTADGVLNDVMAFSDGGRTSSLIEVQEGDSAHPWFNAREAIPWARGTDTLPSFVSGQAAAGLTLPMRSKGQLLGAVILVGGNAQAHCADLAGRAVEQLALALDSTDLYRQATERASRIEAQRNLASIVASAVDLSGAFDAFAEEIRWLIPFERAVMLTIDEAGENAEQVAIYPPIADAEPISMPLAGSVLARILEDDRAASLRRSDETLADLDWTLVGDDAIEVAAVPIRDARQTTAIFALVNSGVADYEQFDLGVLEEVAGLLAVTIDRLRLFERAEHAARHDLLTGLPNYRYLQERLSTLKTDFEDEGQRSAVLMVDMDGLKLYNDTLGHEAGDRAIQRVGEELRSAVRSEDLVARTGGDEFVVVMEDVSEADALMVAQRMHDSLRDIHHEFGNAPVPVRISVGLAFAPDDGTGATELLEAADRAMYAAKFNGGDRTRAAGGDHEAGNGPRTLRRRGNRVMELLIKTAVDGASAPERLAVALAQRYVVAVALGRGLPVDTADPLRMLVAGESAHHLEIPEGYRDQETALMLLDGLRTQWDEQIDAASLQLSELLPAAVRLAWEQIPAPDGPGLTAEQALAIVTNDPVYHLGSEVLELLTESAMTAEFERRRTRRDAA